MSKIGIPRVGYTGKQMIKYKFMNENSFLMSI